MNPLRIFISSVQSEFARERTAVLLFGKSPQRFLISSEVRCAHFHGTEVAKQIPSYQVYKGDAFELVDQALDFVLSKINRSVGTRAEGVRAPRTYEIPAEVVTEAIVNAVAHRDYTDNGSVQVMLFADRLEVRNPGRLPPPLTLEKLREAHRSVPGNPLLAESMYLAEYIERMGTGTLDMIRRCVEAGLPEPEFAVSDGFVTTVWRPVGPERVAVGAEERVTGVASDHVDSHSGPSGKREQAGVQGGWQEGQRESRAGGDGGQAGVQAGVHVGVQAELEARDANMLRACVQDDLASRELQNAGGYAGRTRSFEQRLNRLLGEGLLEMTVPDKPRSPMQRYRLTEKGRDTLRRTAEGHEDEYA